MRYGHKGDNNTDYFHRIDNGRKRKNTIISFNDGDVRIEGEENLIKHAAEFYKTLFGQPPEVLFDLILICMDSMRRWRNGIMRC